MGKPHDPIRDALKYSGPAAPPEPPTVEQVRAMLRAVETTEQAAELMRFAIVLYRFAGQRYGELL